MFGVTNQSARANRGANSFAPSPNPPEPDKPLGPPGIRSDRSQSPLYPSSDNTAPRTNSARDEVAVFARQGESSPTAPARHPFQSRRCSRAPVADKDGSAISHGL